MKSLIFAIAITTSACVAKDDSLTEAEARSAGDALGTGIEDSAKSYGPVKEGSGVEPPCTTLSGDIADADQDSIPASATLTFNCSAMALGYTGTLTGTMMVTDDQPSAVAWAFSAGADLHATLTGPFGGSIVRDWDGSIVATQTTSFALHRTLDVVTVFENAQGRKTTVTEDNEWTVTYTPMVTWTPGTIVVTGSLTATGAWNLTVNEHAAMATIATPTPLTIDPGCATRVTAGTVTGSYSDERGAHTISVTWTACGTRTVTST